ncbi:MAG: hypothetical protein MHMPM18_005233 [Marteilia pararefringens]
MIISCISSQFLTIKLERIQFLFDIYKTKSKFIRDGSYCRYIWLFSNKFLLCTKVIVIIFFVQQIFINLKICVFFYFISFLFLNIGCVSFIVCCIFDSIFCL